MTELDKVQIDDEKTVEFEVEGHGTLTHSLGLGNIIPFSIRFQFV